MCVKVFVYYHFRVCGVRTSLGYDNRDYEISLSPSLGDLNSRDFQKRGTVGARLEMSTEKIS